MNLRGCGTAIVTPFKGDGSIDEKALRAFVAWQVESKIDFLVPCGTTGETPTLNRDEWLRVIEITIEVVAGRVPIVAGATSNCTAEAVERAKTVAAIPGVDAILTASPYYNKPTQEGQYQHFRAIAEAVDKPLVLYNVPGRTAANIEPATLARLAKIPNIRAVKEASGNLSQIADVCNAVPDDFLVFSGDDAVTLPVISLGAANATPALTTTVAGIYGYATAAAFVRARVSTYTSGTVAVTLAQKRQAPPVVGVSLAGGSSALGSVSITGAISGNTNSGTGYTDSTTALAASATFTGTGRSTASQYAYFHAIAYADQSGTLFVEQSLDSGATYQPILTQAVAAATPAQVALRVTGAYGAATLYRVRYVNGAAAQTTFRLSSAFTR